MLTCRTCERRRINEITTAQQRRLKVRYLEDLGHTTDHSCQLKRGLMIRTVHRHDAAVKHQRLVARVQKDIIHPHPEHRVVNALVFGDANPPVLPCRAIVVMRRTG